MGRKPEGQVQVFFNAHCNSPCKLSMAEGFEFFHHHVDVLDLGTCKPHGWFLDRDYFNSWADVDA